MTRMLSGLRRRLAAENGFSMVTVTLGMMVMTTFAVGAYSAAVGDIPIARKDQDRKRALAAASAGLEWYTYHLNLDPNYWSYCDDPTKVTAGVNLQGSKASQRTLPSSEEKFAIEMMTADGSTITRSQCLADPAGKLLKEGVLRIRSTGYARGRTRQIVSTYRRSSFLDYIYYTKWETLAPAAASDPSWATANCDQRRSLRPSGCTNIQFADQDFIKGPLHTEDDSLLTCGSPTFGRSPADNIEVSLASSPASAYLANCSGSPSTQGTLVAPAPSIDLPPSNGSLSSVANYLYTGNTCVILNGGTATVWPNQTNWGASTSNPIPCNQGSSQSVTLGASTVFYAQNGVGCSGTYQREQRYTDPSSCGNIAVRGTYGGNVTIGAANDVIVTGDFTRVGDQIAGLIAQNFVRVYHFGRNASDSGCDSSADVSRVNTIESAILALNSFIVDNWSCGDPLGDLTVTGAIAQKWRGPVGTGGGGSSTGYIKGYNYDDRLKYRSPPQFIDPVKASWHILRQSEQTPVL